MKDVLTIDRVGLRYEATKEVCRGVVVSYMDDITIAVVDFRIEDMALLEAVAKVRDNASLDEIFYFAEMNGAAVRVDGVDYPHLSVNSIVAVANKMRLFGNEAPGVHAEDIVGKEDVKPVDVPVQE